MSRLATAQRLTLAALVEDIRAVVARTTGLAEQAAGAGAALAPYLAGPDLLDEEDRRPDAGRYRQVVLHAEPDGAFSIVALIWLPGQRTAIHDHLAWCVVGVLQGAETETTFTLETGPEGCRLRPGERRTNDEGDVAVLLPPGDIHFVANESDDVAISIHVYGVDVTRVGSSIRRVYDRYPVEPLPST